MFYTDSDLSPYTTYSYHLITSNIRANTSSAAVSVRTLSAVPELEELQLTMIGRPRPTSASFNWTELLNTTGPVENYTLSSVSDLTGEERIHYIGLQTEASAEELHPFTRYNFSLQACTNGGCSRSESLMVLTAQIPPEQQPAPRITTLGPTQLKVEWEPPALPNGIIIRYELFMQLWGNQPTSQSPEQRVFLASGWLDPRPSMSSANENALTPPESGAVVSNLEPFLTYRFRVLTVNMAGSAMSEWAVGRTAEGVPEFMIPPQVTPVSSSSLRVNWERPQDKDIRGEVTEYRINLQMEQASNPYAPPILTQVLYSGSAQDRSYTVSGLKPYRQYNFTVTVCNRQGCVSSLPGSGRTLPSAPADLKAPVLNPVNMTAMKISWDAPAELNGPPPVYHVERTDVSFSDAQGRVIRGRRFMGSGYFRFPSSTLPVNADFTGLQLSFRTRAEDGLILFAVSPGEQEEFVALQILQGRPYFLFDPQASAVALTPHNDGGRRYNDNQWHHLIATRKQAVGTIIVDSQYSGSGSATSGSTIIGQNTGVYIGGIPENITIFRHDTGSAKLVRQGFAGCLRDVLIQKSSGTGDVWEPLDWDTSLENHETYEGWEGCPAVSEDGAYFLGHGFLKVNPEVFPGGDYFEMSFAFKTDQLNALLLFAYDVHGKDFILAELQGGVLFWVLRWGEQTVEMSVWVGLSYCDGAWNTLNVLKRGSLVSAGLNDVYEQERRNNGGPLTITSPLYLGGVPSDVSHPALNRHSLLHGFGGCIRDVRFARGPVVSLAAVSSSAVRVNLDGCLSADTSVNCRGNDSILVYTGRDKNADDLTLQPFTEYLYRVTASGEGGWTAGPWQRGRSRETVPQSVLPPSRVESVNGSSVEVSWEEPPEVRGVIEKYVLKAYSRERPTSSPISAAFPHSQHLTGTLSGLAPFSSYSITLTTCTQAGCGESPFATSFSTPQEAPEEVVPPGAIPYPNSLYVYWNPPSKPNGIITQYILYKDSSVVYQGNSTSFNITGVGVFTPHKLMLSVCTEAGCTNSTQITLFTGQLPPTRVEPPVLTVLDAHSVHIQWVAPMEVNGLLEFYTLYQSALGEVAAIVYNSSELFEDYTARNLVPGTTYLFQIAACTGGGCTLSDPSITRTEESSPEDVPAPNILPLSTHSLNVSWTPPRRPNGVISSYGLWMDGALVQNSSLMSFQVGDLSPWSLHGFRVQACTAEGCALGPLVESRTLEMPPAGHLTFDVISETPHSVRAKWEAPAEPNGNLTYTILFTGPGQNFSSVETPDTETRELLSTGNVGQWVSIGGLQPYSNYSVLVKACNSQGCVESSPTIVLLPPGAPDGLLPPRLAAATPTSLQVAWAAPVRPNAPGPLRYRIQMRTSASTQVHQLMDNETTIFSHMVTGLKPFTEYHIRLLVSNSHGETSSPWVSLFTAQDRPGSLDPPVLSNIQPRRASVNWTPPSQPNGIITHYNIYQNHQLSVSVPGNTTSHSLSKLGPYQHYNIQVEACTTAGCTLSAESNSIHTPPAPPEDVPVPQLYSDTPTSVLINWSPPLRVNGELDGYTVERKLTGSQYIQSVAIQLPNKTLTYLDSSADLSPWTTYEYRIVANTRLGGSNSSEWEKVTTRPSRPAGLQPPHVSVLGPDSVQVTWSAPLIPNGEVERYEIRMPHPLILHTNVSLLNRTVSGLVPYNNYSIIVLACSGGGGHVGGCTESLPTVVTTLPTIPQGLAPLSVVAVSESFLAVSWQMPLRANGPNIRFELLRRKTQQPLASRPPEDLNQWYNVYAGTKLFHEDKGLSRYTWYEYKLLVHNDVGHSSGEVTTGVTLAGQPVTPTNASIQVLNHTAILASWSPPTLQDLQGSVEVYIITVISALQTQTITLDPTVTSVVISDLQPSTEYKMSLTVSNGAHNITGHEVTCTTLDGEPEGVFPPEVVTLNSTAVRVMWAAPIVPNGAVTEYFVYLDGRLYETATNESGSLEVVGLLPFTVHNIQVEVCTVYACVKSNSTQVTTVEDTPADINTPYIQVLNSRSVKLQWTSPGKPNGILGGYDVWRRILQACEDVQDQQVFDPHCMYLECPVDQDFCGMTCYKPDIQICCAGNIHNLKDSHQCCEERYLTNLKDLESVCCGGQFVKRLPQHRCCSGYYVPVQPGEICCPDPVEQRVSVGLGDSCCGGSPYLSGAGQICCGGRIYDGYNSQCCGGQLVSGEMMCCGDDDKGMAHSPVTGFACCGENYINTSNSWCCTGPDGKSKVHVLENRTASLKCCWSEVIDQEDECCNGVAFNPLTSVCADRAPARILIPENCRPNKVCPASKAATAYCGLCDFSQALSICTWVPQKASNMQGHSSSPIDSASSQTSASLSTAHSQLCPSTEKLVYSGLANKYSFTDTELEPYTSYEYRIGAWNSYGRGFSPVYRITTYEDVPRGVTAPRWSHVGLRDDIIHLEWSTPNTPNGEISHYVILRDGQERYRGTDHSFTDAGGIRPFQEYMYQLRACTTAGCTDSPKVVAVTVQREPEGIRDPAVSPLGARALKISWTAPAKPNGIIREYFINQSGVGIIHRHTQGKMAYNVTGLQPNSNYSFIIVACTAAGCGASQPSMGRTLEDSPADVWAVPRHIQLNFSAVELYWSQPLKPNGLISRYRLLRDGVVIFSGDGEETSYTDAGLQPNTRYVYTLEATTGGGSSLSEGYVIQTPVSSPDMIPSPYNVSLRGPRSIFVAWSPPGVYNSSAHLEYNVLLNAGTERPLIRPAGLEHFLLLQGLDPYTKYHIQVQACQPDGCGVGPGVSVRTPEAAPLAQDPPVLIAVGAGVIEIHWSPPHKPNGLITKYFIYRRPIGTQKELLVFIWTEGALNFTDASDALLPFREYEYRVSAHNSKGSTSSSWASIRTLEAEPQGMDSPTARATGAYSLLLSWNEPTMLNGLILKYRLVYQKIPKDPTFNSTSVTALTVTGSIYQARIFGLEPYVTYNVRVEAVNGAGQLSSPWVNIQTLEASPSGVANFSVEKREHGRALLLHWPEPASPNGIIKMYNIYNEGNLEFSGLVRHFLFRRLEPYTEYILILEACTEAGCTKTAPQHVMTEEAPPASQSAPTVQESQARSVELRWAPPVQSNGRILQYQVLAVSLEDARVRSEEDDSLRAKIVFTENNTQAEHFVYNMSGLLPWSRYKFRIRVKNAAGYADSPWLVVQTKQAAPRGLAAPVVNHIDLKPNELFISWTPPLEPNGVLLTYRIERDNIGFHFSFDSSVRNYTDLDLAAYTLYSYAVIACTIAGCVTSAETYIRTLEAAPANMGSPTVSNITSFSFNVSWVVPSVQNGEIGVYILKVNDEEVYRGKRLNVQVLDLKPHVSYIITLTACTNGGCTASSPIFVQTTEAAPIGMPAPVLKVTGPESVEVTWREPLNPNGVITGYELYRNGGLIYTGMDMRYHDFTLLPSVEYSYTIIANNSQGAAISPPAVATTQASAPSGVAPPRLEASGPFSVMVQWDPPARPNGIIINYSLYKRDPAEPNLKRFVFASHHSVFQSQRFSLTELKPYYRYEVRVEACTLLGCAASDWSSVQTLESPPIGQPAPLLELQTNTKGLQTVFLVSWSPPAQPNGKLLHYELYRKQISDTESRSVATLVYRNSSNSCHDYKLQPYTAYEYQVLAVNSVGRTGSPWAQGRTGPAPPEGMSPPKFLHIHATSAVVDIKPPVKPNGIISLYRVFTLNKNSYQLLSEGTSHQQTLYGLKPFTLYSVGVEACTCFLCCSRGPLSELRTQASAPAQQSPPFQVNITSRSALVEWDKPLEPNGVIESYELHVRSACSQPLQPVSVSCVIGPVEIKFFGIGQSFNITGLLPYASYELRVVSHNNMGSTVSDWVSITTLKEPPQFKQTFVVQSNITSIFLDWSSSFALNGRLREYTLTESNIRIYSGFHSSLHIPRTSDKTFVFQVTCTTDSGSANSPVIKYNTAIGTEAVESSSGGKTGLYGAEYKFYSELWFIILMAFLGLLLLALLMGLVLRRALSKPPFIRERPPIIPLQRRSTKYPPNDSYPRPSSELCSNHASTALLQPDETMALTDTKVAGTCTSNHSYQTSMSVLRVPSQSQLSHAFSQNSLHRSISQLIDTQDKKSLGGGAWDADLHGTDSGMFVGDDEFVETIKSYSSVKKEQTMFTDTHL